MAMYVNKVYLLFKRPDHDQIEFDVDELTELKEKSDSSSDSKNWLKSDSKSPFQSNFYFKLVGQRISRRYLTG